MPFVFWDKVQPSVEILVLAFVFYRILVFFQGTRAFQVLKGLAYFLVLFLLSKIIGLNILSWLLAQFVPISILAFIIIFQQEIRQGLARLGQGQLFTIFLEEAEVLALIEEIVDAVFKLSDKRTGCIIGVEREVQLKTYIESGISIDGVVSSELIRTIFDHEAPMHDGGVILRGQRIVAAACLFPLSENQNLSKIIGTRHRAALGLTEQTDAVAVLVSEETGEVSVACDGKFIPVTGPDRLRVILKDLFVRPGNIGKNRK